MGLKKFFVGFLCCFFITGILLGSETAAGTAGNDREAVLAALDSALSWISGENPEKFWESQLDPATFLAVGPFKKASFGLPVAFFWPGEDFQLVSRNSKNLHLLFSKNRDCAWFYQQLHLHFSSPKIAEDWIDLRWSGVLVKRNGKWLLAMQHVSLPDGESGYEVTKEAQLQKWEKQSGDSGYEAVRDAINGSIGWVKNKDLQLLYGIIMNSPDFLEIHPEDNVVKGFENFRQNERFWMHENFAHVSFDISDLKIVFSPGKDCAWFYCVLNDRNSWQGRVMSWENTRWTGFLEKIDGKWRLWHSHFSYAGNPKD